MARTPMPDILHARHAAALAGGSGPMNSVQKSTMPLEFLTRESPPCTAKNKANAYIHQQALLSCIHGVPMATVDDGGGLLLARVREVSRTRLLTLALLPICCRHPPPLLHTPWMLVERLLVKMMQRLKRTKTGCQLTLGLTLRTTFLQP